MTQPQNQNIDVPDDVGTIGYADDVIAVIAGLAATEVEGVAGMSGGIAEGISELLGRKNLTKGVKVEVGSEEAAIDLYVVIEYGKCIPDVCVAIQENVKKTVELMTGLTIVEINVHVQGVHFEKETKEAESARVR